MYLHIETYIVIPKIEPENLVCVVLHKNQLLFFSHLLFSGETSIDLNREGLQAPRRALALREKALYRTLSSHMVEHASDDFTASYKFW